MFRKLVHDYQLTNSAADATLKFMHHVVSAQDTVLAARQLPQTMRSMDARDAQRIRYSGSVGDDWGLVYEELLKSGAQFARFRFESVLQSLVKARRSRS